jgi:hypothetical protein
VFLSAHLDAEGREILRGMRIDRFIIGNDDAYGSIRTMRQHLRHQRESR